MAKTKRVEETKRKCVTLGKAIIGIVKPRTFLSPLLHCLSLLLYKKYASRHLIDQLANSGFCALYHEAQKLEMSAIDNEKPGSLVKKRAFNQNVFDNVGTIDVDTLHAMVELGVLPPQIRFKKVETFQD